MGGEEKIVKRALASRESLLELLVLAMVLAFGINLASTYLTDYLGEKSSVTCILGVVLIMLPLAYLIWKLKRSLTNSIELDAFFALDLKTNRPLEIPGYVLSEKLKKIMTAAFVENVAYARIWDENKLAEKTSTVFPNLQVVKAGQTNPVFYSAVFEAEKKAGNSSKSEKLLIEAVEYLMIEEISDQLSSFSKSLDEKSNLAELTRFDIKELSLSNRFLRLFTTPLEEREIYSKLQMPTLPEGASLKSITGTDGSLFSSLNIFLPVKSSIARPLDGKLIISSERAKILLTVSYTDEKGMGPDHFIELYMGKHPDSVALLKLKVSVEVKVPLKSLLNIEGWRYYEWADSIPEKISGVFDFQTFIDRIQWSQIRSQARVNTIAKRLEAKLDGAGPQK